jgi:hypothetical protein
MPDFCKHIAGERFDHEALRINCHKSACQSVHAAIHKPAKGGGALHNTRDPILVMADTGLQSQTPDETRESLSSTLEGENPDPILVATPPDWLAHVPTTEDIRSMRHTDVSQDSKYNQRDLSAAEGDTECTSDPRCIKNEPFR